jgi:hypothetical protein
MLLVLVGQYFELDAVDRTKMIQWTTRKMGNVGTKYGCDSMNAVWTRTCNKCETGRMVASSATIPGFPNCGSRGSWRQGWSNTAKTARMFGPTWAKETLGQLFGRSMMGSSLRTVRVLHHWPNQLMLCMFVASKRAIHCFCKDGWHHQSMTDPVGLGKLLMALVALMLSSLQE